MSEITNPNSDPAGPWYGTHIWFLPLGIHQGQTTMRWEVMTKENHFLGTIKWFGRWRKYCFFPAAECVFEETCLGEIAIFIKDRTHDHRHGV